MGRFYLLPKIHERLFNVPGRPVISNCGTLTKQISAFVKTLPYIVKDTTDFLCKLREPGVSREGAFLSTMDIVGLYPHIPHEEGVLSLAKILKVCEGA